MQQNNKEIYPYQNDEIDLRKLFNSLVEKKLFIFSFTALLTLLAIIYALHITPTYKAISSFTSPSTSSILNINKMHLTKESKESVFTNFLRNISSQELQTKVFLDGDYLTVFNPENNPIDNVNNFILGTLKSLKVNTPNVTAKELELGFLTELPYSISIEGANAESISMYLNDLVITANNNTIEKMMGVIRQKVAIRLDEIAIERELLLTAAERDRLSKIEQIKEEDAQKIREINDRIDALRLKAKRERLNQIERIKEEDAQKIREINDQIDRARFKAKEDRFNEIVVLTDAAILARSLGVKENNFKLIGDETNSNLTIAIGKNNDLPKWYLYGEKALLERVELLESRTSDDPFVPELVILKNKLNEVQNNNLLKTLEARQDDDPFVPEIVALKMTLKEVQFNNVLKTLKARQDDSPFVAEIIKLDIERTKLESTIIDSTGVNTMQISQVAIAEPIKSKKRMIVVTAFIVSFMMSIFLTLIMDVLRPDKQAA